ncbi:hypothetical protein QFC24_006593 [Naganishia onofrii]|uniref:Uncharacterized protein n=1 Tax=Naganishia onofrii TaxID=1851511 RepID=A0ACC2X1B2_9TREE|nr:hypothetical protein QFC24_006593 [Naganishia onofrii]
MSPTFARTPSSANSMAPPPAPTLQQGELPERPRYPPSVSSEPNQPAGSGHSHLSALTQQMKIGDQHINPQWTPEMEYMPNTVPREDQSVSEGSGQGGYPPQHPQSSASAVQGAPDQSMYQPHADYVGYDPNALSGYEYHPGSGFQGTPLQYSQHSMRYEPQYTQDGSQVPTDPSNVPGNSGAYVSPYAPQGPFPPGTNPYGNQPPSSASNFPGPDVQTAYTDTEAFPERLPYQPPHSEELEPYEAASTQRKSQLLSAKLFESATSTDMPAIIFRVFSAASYLPPGSQQNTSPGHPPTQDDNYNYNKHLSWGMGGTAPGRF